MVLQLSIYRPNSQAAYLPDFRTFLCLICQKVRKSGTNIEDDALGLIFARYAQLWIIEDSFRVNKHLLKMRPIFHWKPNRIHAHIAMCYMSFAILRHMQYRVSMSQKVSPEVIMEELMMVQASIYLDKKAGGLYRIPGKFINTARKIYKAFDINRSLDVTIYF